MSRRKDWLRHPPRTIGQYPKCPSGLPRFASRNAAMHAGSAYQETKMYLCPFCNGFHHEPPTTARDTHA